LPYPPVENADKPERQYFFIRADKLDNPYPGLSQAVTAGGALGASINYTGNDFVQATKTTKYGSYVNVSTTNSVTVSGLASVALLNPDPFYRGAWPLDFIGAVAMPSLWVSANGNSDQPTKPFGDTSALKAGIEGDVLFPDRVDLPGTNLHLFDMNYFGVAPFYQTDFYGHAQAEGATVSWTPSNHDIFVMGAPDDFKPTLVDGFLEIRAEATYLNVGQPGHTLLHQGSYEWLGAAVRSYIFFFPTRGGVDWSSVPYLADKLSFVGTYQNYWDANSHATAGMFSAALQYKLGKCDSSAQQPIEPGKKPLNCYYGAPSVSAQFDWGTDRDTLQHTKKITVKLSYAY
jgi:hypothetical protein